MVGPTLLDMVHVCLCRAPIVLSSARLGLGPLLFVLYTAELEDKAAEMGINIHMYADDTQLYIHCKPSYTIDAVAKLERCIAVVDNWMAASPK